MKLMENKQTAVEWFANELAKKGLLVIRDYKNLIAYRQAKEMEKQQITDAWDNGCEDDGIIDNAEDYYNETFNTKNQ